MTEIECEMQNDEILAVDASPVRSLLLDEAKFLTCGDRNSAYGEPVASMAHIAAIYNAISGQSMSARDAALFQVATKLARLSKNAPHRDSYIDGMAYLGIAYECALSEDSTQKRICDTMPAKG